MNIHQRAKEPIEMVQESFREILFTVRKCLDYRKTQDKDYWSTPHNTPLGVLGFPSAILMFSLVDAIGSYYEGNKEMQIKLRGEKNTANISTSVESHFYILNSEYFALNLSKEDVTRIYECRNSLLHNNVLTNEIQLKYSSERPFIHPTTYQDGDKAESFFQIRLISFLQACENAFEMFMSNKDIIKKDLTESDKLLKNRKNFHSESKMQSNRFNG